MSRLTRAWSAGLALWVLTGCGKPAQVHVNELPVQRVVVYRNGVAYFERAGRVDGEQVKFSLRRENVGDFLATLAILEKGGSSVKAASFPVELEEAESPSDPAFEAAMDAWEGKRPQRRGGLRTVTLELDGGTHELTVGYLAETPVWRPSYRLVVDGKGQAELQAWGIVQNQSGEDWTDVEISLVAGAPIAFESDLGEPIVPPRPLVTDGGEIVGAVPEGDMLYEQVQPAAPPAAPAPEPSAYDDLEEQSQQTQKASPSKPAASRARRSQESHAEEDSAGALGAGGIGVAGGVSGVGSLRDPSRLATVAAQTGSTRYDVPVRVTIPDRSATMVLLISATIPGEAVYLYSPDGGVPDSYRHPFRVARFKNESGGLLEKGPIAVFEKGAFLGQGLMSSLPSRASASVPFALVRGISVQPSYSSEQRGSRLYSIVDGRLTIEVDQAVLTTYRVQNGEQSDVRLLVRHPRNAQAKLWQPPSGTEEDLADGVAFVPVQVKAFGAGELVVEERYPSRIGADFRSAEGRAAIADYLKSASPSEKAPLEKILALAVALGEGDDSERALRREQQELEKSSRETRLSIEAIEKNASATALRAELTERLRKTTARLEQITKELVTLGLRRSENEVRLKQAIEGLTVPPPDRRAGSR